MVSDQLSQKLAKGISLHYTRRQLLKRGVVIGIGAPVVASLLAACGDDDEPESDDPAAEPGDDDADDDDDVETVEDDESDDESDEPSPEASGGRVVIPIVGNPQLLNPILRGSITEIFIQNAMFRPLMRANPETLESEPLLAETWEVDDSGAELTVSLREGVEWHDGTPVTADDIKFTFDKVMEPETLTGFTANVTDLESVDVVDTHTATFNLSSPSSAFVSSMQIHLIPKHILEDEDDINIAGFNQNPLGCGPFKFERFVDGDEVTLVANEEYFGGRPHLDELIYKVIPDVNVRLAQIRTGEVNVVDAVEPAQLEQLEGNPDISIYRMNQTSYFGFFVNWQKPPFDDIRVRRALNHAVDKQAIVDRVLLGEATLATSVFPPALDWAHTSDVETQEYDPERAIALLAEAGWEDNDGDGIVEKDGEPFQFSLVGDTGSATRRQIVTLGQQFFIDIGLDVQIEFYEWNDFLENYQWSPDKEMTLLWNAFNPPIDPDALARRWHSASGPRENQTAYNNPRVDELFALAKQEFDQDVRQQHYHEIQRIIAEDVPFVILYYPVEIAAAQSNLRGIVPSPIRIYHNMEEWYWES
jgi:peptide/nickel transport system substrate-binding protein